LLLFSDYFSRQFRDGNPFGRSQYGISENYSIKTLKVYVQVLNNRMFFIFFCNRLETTGKPSRFVVLTFTMNLPHPHNAE